MVFTSDDVGDVSGLFHVENDDRDIAFTAHIEGGEVHDFEILIDGLREGEVFEASSVWVFDGVFIVDAIDFGCFEKNIGTDFSGTQ